MKTANTYSKKHHLKSQLTQGSYAKKNNASKTLQSTLQSSQYRHGGCRIEQQQQRVNYLKVSLEKSQQIGENQYKKAMKHMKLMNSLEKQSKQKQRDHFQIITSQHTFRPRINKNSQLNYLYEAHSLSAQKLHHLKNTGAQDRQRNEMKVYDRLIKWGKTHIDKRRDDFIRLQVDRDSKEKPSKMIKKPQIFVDMDRTVSSIQKVEQNFTMNSSRTFQLGKKAPRPYINGEQKFYQKQAKAVALKNGETFYYSASRQDLNVTR